VVYSARSIDSGSDVIAAIPGNKSPALGSTPFIAFSSSQLFPSATISGAKTSGESGACNFSPIPGKVLHSFGKSFHPFIWWLSFHNITASNCSLIICRNDAHDSCRHLFWFEFPHSRAKDNSARSWFFDNFDFLPDPKIRS